MNFHFDDDCPYVHYDSVGSCNKCGWVAWVGVDVLDAEDIAYLKAQDSDEWQRRGGGGL